MVRSSNHRNEASYDFIKEMAAKDAYENRRPYYIVYKPGKVMTVTSASPGGREWLKNKYEWLETVRPSDYHPGVNYE